MKNVAVFGPPCTVVSY